MRKVVPPLVAYLIVCLVVLIIPASEGYNSVGWKLFVGQLYAVPILIIVAVITFFVSRKSSVN
ncbi:DUF4017 family protein [Sutcliffiella deserti]|uniref:DUF4017 family protein n=1 Tax=Sutcliffiella deserti TaxID=2875501 RepID=UPI001CC1B5FC|nr:DUF4017 family protein [Sutcliffiella deserti]